MWGGQVINIYMAIVFSEAGNCCIVVQGRSTAVGVAKTRIYKFSPRNIPPNPNTSLRFQAKARNKWSARRVNLYCYLYSKLATENPKDENFSKIQHGYLFWCGGQRINPTIGNDIPLPPQGLDARFEFIVRTKKARRINICILHDKTLPFVSTQFSEISTLLRRNGVETDWWGRECVGGPNWDAILTQ